MKLWRSLKYINISCNTLLWLVPEETLILENASLKLLNSTQMNRMEMSFPSRQAQPCWFPRTAHGFGAIPFLFEVLNINKPDLMIWLFWITQNTVCVKHLLLHSPCWDFLSSHFHLMRCPNPPHHQEPQNAIFHIPKGWSWHVCAAEKKKSLHNTQTQV